jgi:hypothetical protein
MPAATPTADTAFSTGVLSRREAIFVCVTAALVMLMGAGLCAAAILVPAPAAVVPLIALSCVVMPLLAGWRLPGAVSALRGQPRRFGELSLAALRRELDRLPETDHPLGH